MAKENAKISSCYKANNVLLFSELEIYRINLITTGGICFHVNEKWINLECCCLCASEQIFSAFDMKIHLCSFRWLGHNFRITHYVICKLIYKSKITDNHTTGSLHKLSAGFYFRISIHGLNQNWLKLLAPYFQRKQCPVVLYLILWPPTSTKADWHYVQDILKLQIKEMHPEDLRARLLNFCIID